MACVSGVSLERAMSESVIFEPYEGFIIHGLLWGIRLRVLAYLPEARPAFPYWLARHNKHHFLRLNHAPCSSLPLRSIA